MTIALVAAVAFTTGAAASTAITWRHLTLRYDLHHYHQVRREATSITAVVETATEHAHEAITEAITEARSWIGDLLDQVADKDREIDELTRARHLAARPRPYAAFTYGPGAA